MLDVFFLSLSIYKCIHTHARERETNNATVVDCDDEAVGRERERDERDERTAVEVVSFVVVVVVDRAAEYLRRKTTTTLTTKKKR